MHSPGNGSTLVGLRRPGSSAASPWNSIGATLNHRVTHLAPPSVHLCASLYISLREPCLFSKHAARSNHLCWFVPCRLFLFGPVELRPSQRPGSVPRPGQHLQKELKAPDAPVIQAQIQSDGPLLLSSLLGRQRERLWRGCRNMSHDRHVYMQIVSLIVLFHTSEKEPRLMGTWRTWQSTKCPMWAADQGSGSNASALFYPLLPAGWHLLNVFVVPVH